MSLKQNMLLKKNLEDLLANQSNEYVLVTEAKHITWLCVDLRKTNEDLTKSSRYSTVDI
jgi:hypothetical protein